MGKMGFLFILGLVSLAVYLTNSAQQSMADNKCFDYVPIASFRQGISSEAEAADLAVGYFNGLGINVPPEALMVVKNESGWTVELSPRWTMGMQICQGGMTPPDCVGRTLRLETKTRQWNQVLMEYEVDCPKK